MTIAQEIAKLKATKTTIRKAIQRKNTGLQLTEIYPNYYTYIQNMSDTKNPDETGLKDYVEDSISYLEITVDKIRPYAFSQFTCLQGLYLNNENFVPLKNINAFSGIFPTIFVPADLLETYKADSVWSKMASRIQAYSAQTVLEMYPIQHVDKVQTVSWVQGKTVGELIKDFR